MKEDGIDISGHSSNHIDEYKDIAFDFVITVCDNAKRTLPLLSNKGTKISPQFSGSR
jgi:arsenate reductase